MKSLIASINHATTNSAQAINHPGYTG